MRKMSAGLMIVLSIMILAGCGKEEDNEAFMDENIRSASTIETAENASSNLEADEMVNVSDEDTMYIYSDVEKIKDYDTVEDLLNDSCALVKVMVLQADSANVRSYIYTTYSMEVREVLYGEIGESVINVNLPGGIMEGEDARRVISEVTEGKDAGDLSGFNNIMSNGNTNRLLTVGDEAYLFLIPESDIAYAVVGEYNGEMLLDNGNVLFDSNIIGFHEGDAAYGVNNGIVSESEFIEVIREMISTKN